ncbi:hypothetical protein C8Q75DRAFT_213090 [Abortiporus biennis]|nr:hypothetical protein C8Q75DRAFT_213090 [Abortiporus biennis]
MKQRETVDRQGNDSPSGSRTVPPVASASDSEWSNGSDWSVNSSGPSSPSSPIQRPYTSISSNASSSRVGGGVPRQPVDLYPAMKPDHGHQAHFSDLPNLVRQQPEMFTPNGAAAIPEPVGPTRRTKHVPRPPNAFMLFRARVVNPRLPQDLTNRQQMVSIIAGQCWNMMSDEQKQEWHNQAKEALAEHHKKFPGYRFSPARKSRKQMGSGRDAEEDKNNPEFQRLLREKYMCMVGPSAAPSRKKARKSKSKSKDDVQLTPPIMPLPGAFAMGTQQFDPAMFPPYPPSMYNAPFFQGLPPSAAHFMTFGPDSLPDWSSQLMLNHLPSPPKQQSSSSASSSSASTSTTPNLSEALPIIDHDKTPTAASFSIPQPRGLSLPQFPPSSSSSAPSGSGNTLNLNELTLPYAGFNPALTFANSMVPPGMDPNMNFNPSMYGFPMYSSSPNMPPMPNNTPMSHSPLSDCGVPSPSSVVDAQDSLGNKSKPATPDSSS